MRNKKQTVPEAMRLADEFVRKQLLKGKELLKEGKVYEAYFEFGVGLHTLQDATSPAHGGFRSGEAMKVLVKKETMFKKS
jgi:hypothetical protein